jgi:hypothetical protein
MHQATSDESDYETKKPRKGKKKAAGKKTKGIHL